MAPPKKIMEKIIVRARPGETKIALVGADGRLIDYAVYRDLVGSGLAGAELAGRVMLGRVRRVNAAMEAAFVDIGSEKDGFLGVSDARVSPGEEEKNISSLLHEGEAAIVQVLADGRETKGPKLTRRINLTGELAVYSPLAGISARVSSRVRDKAERQRLLHLGEKLAVEKSATIIIRSAAGGASDDEIINDINLLQGRWREIESRARTAAPPLALDDRPRALAMFIADIGAGKREITSDDGADRALGAEIYTGRDDIFAHFAIADEVAGILDPEVRLAGGGSIIIEETAAVTAIDVNSGSATGRGEDLALKTNTEALAEAARQIRIRNMAGKIIIDLMPMGADGEKKMIAAMKKSLAADPLGPRLHGISNTGLMEITRRRRRQPLSAVLNEPCPHCPDGHGPGALTIALEALARAVDEAMAGQMAMLELVAHPDVIREIENRLGPALNEVEKKLGQPLELKADPELGRAVFRVEKARS